MKLKKFCKLYDGQQWIYESDDGKRSISIICHEFSYGGEVGNFEVFPSWEDDVTGFLTFGQVQKFLNQLDKKNKKVKQ